jgi:cation transport ATPase
MAQSDPEPEPTTEAEAEAAATEVPEKTQAEKDAEAADQARRAVNRFLWSCAWLTVLVGVFLVSGMIQSDRSFGVLGWLGAVLTCACLVALTAAYVLCARDRLTLRTRVLGPFDFFQVSTVVVVVAVICGLLVPTSNKSALALLFPWALTYWMYGLDRTKKPADEARD